MRRFLGVLLIALGLLQLGVWGALRVRNEIPLWDFASVYSAARTWTHGGDPYDLGRVAATWRESGVFSKRDTSYWATVYPPTTLVMLVPLAELPVDAALVAWLAIILALLVLQFAALADLTGLDRRDPRTLLLVGASIVAAPLQFGILSGQLSLPTISLCILAFWCSRRERKKLGGVLLGLACALKPQLAAGFGVYFLIRRRGKLVTLALISGGVICAVALAAMRFSHVNWLAGWTQSIAASKQVGGVNDYSSANGFRDEIIDLKMLLVGTGAGPVVLRIAIECIVIALFAVYLRLMGRDGERSERHELLVVAGIAALSLLPLYHRVYDAAFLTVALSWALAELDGSRRGYAWAVLVPMALLLVPFDIMQVPRYRAHGLALWSLYQTRWCQLLVAPLYAWGVLGVTVALLAALGKEAGKHSAD
jgi:glycosyl transferase family 87